MCAVGNRDSTCRRIPLDVVPLKAPRGQLHNIHMALCDKIAGALIVGEVIALERDRRGLIRCHRMPEILLHRLYIGEQFFLLLRETVCPLLTAAVFDKIQPLNARVAVPAVCSIGTGGKDGTCGGQRK